MKRRWNPSRKIRVMIVDDHPIVRQGVAELISQEEDMEICGQAAEASDALALLPQAAPDVAIIDISLGEGSGLDLIKSIRSQSPDVVCLVLTMHDGVRYARRSLAAGARGYLMKTEPAERIVEAVRRSLEGQICVNEELASQLIGLVISGRPASDEDPVQSLSDRELEVFRLIGEGRETSQIAEALHLSPSTVDVHRMNIRRKLGLTSSVALHQAAYAWLQGQNA